MATTIEQLRAKVEAAEAYRQAADITLARAQADLAEANGDEERARFYRAYADAQEHGGKERHETFMRLSAEQKARRVLLGETTLDDHSAWERPDILAAIERLRETKPSEAQP